MHADKFKHFPVVRAVNADTNSVYCMWDDEVRAAAQRSGHAVHATSC